MTLPLPVARSLPGLDSPIALDARNLKKSYGRGKQRFDAVRDVSLRLHAGEVMAFYHVGVLGVNHQQVLHLISCK